LERRVLLAIVLSFLVIYGFQRYFIPPAPKKPIAANAPAAALPDAPQSAAPDVVAPGAAPAEPAAAPLVGDTAARDITVETPDVIAVFTNRGARLKSWRLKAYQDRNHEPLELVATELTTQPLPMSLRTADDKLTATLNGSLYTLKSAPPAGVIAAPTLLTFEYRDSAGVSAVKEFQIDPASFTLSLRATVTQNGASIIPEIEWGPGLGDNDSQTGRSAVLPGGLYSTTGSVSRLAAKAIAAQPVYDSDFEYVGIDDHYFLSVALKPGKARVSYSTLAVPGPEGSKDPARQFVAYKIQPAAADQAITFYAGPKNFDTLAKLDRNLTKAINFGIFSVIVVPLLRALNWMHGVIGNYGWSIFWLTILINVVLFPLNHKSVVSMRKMQEIQPEAKAIQDRYAKLKATDPAKQKMNQELMGLYREKGVNPASGCIPILLTLPIFWAFYTMLGTAIELRGAPFFGWIHDLSQPDPYYVLPVLVGVSQIVTQWMTPNAGMDPAQQRMMMIMPVMLSFIFISSPTGALIYWLVGNVWRLAQMQLTNLLIGPPKIRTKTVSPADERRLKRVGAGRSEGAAREN
jgi:YidC/Oxa1 family membrane protein insertase